MFKALAPRLDLKSALRAASERNDLLPPRPEDKVVGELGARFVEYLQKKLEEDAYRPTPAEFVQVPKPGFTSRPAALLTLPDRVLYEALVGLVRGRMAKTLIGDDIVFWPRESYTAKRWLEFERAPLSERSKYVVRADVTGFYDSIDHQELEDDLVYLTGGRDVASTIRRFLSAVMGGRRGVPQGLRPSDTLATSYLQPVDTEMIRAGFRYWRHGDDIRVAADNFSDAREAVSLMEMALRNRGLLINSGKCAILTTESYQEELSIWEAGVQATKARLLAFRNDLLAEDQNELLDAMRQADLGTQWEWDLFYHERVSVDEVLVALEHHLQPSEVEIAESIFLDTIKLAPGTENGLSKEEFHQRLAPSLVRLTAARSTAALSHAASLIAKYPEKTEIVCRYLEALVQTNGASVMEQLENVIGSRVFMLPWQLAWLLRTAASTAAHATSETVINIANLSKDEGAHWLVRVEALKFLGSANLLDQKAIALMWRVAPANYRPDLIAAVTRVADKHSWARSVLSTASLDPIEKVIAAHAVRANA